MGMIIRPGHKGRKLGQWNRSAEVPLSSSFNPGILGGGNTLKFWVRADKGITISTGVSQWNDLTSNANNITQGTGSAQPALISGGQNNKPLVRFVSANSQVLSKATTDLIGSGAYTFFWVGKVADSASEKAFFGNSNGVGGAVLIKTTANVREDAHVAVALYDDTTMPTTAEFWTVVRPAAALPALWVNGVSTALSAGSATLSAGGGTNKISLGARDNGGSFLSFIDGDIYEAGIYSTDLSASDRLSLENYLHKRYAL